MRAERMTVEKMLLMLKATYASMSRKSMRARMMRELWKIHTQYEKDRYLVEENKPVSRV